MNYILLGLKHSGKSTVGSILADSVGFDFVDTDALVEDLVGMSVRRYYSEHGKDAFMRAEYTACHSILQQQNDGRTLVIATGGGICDNEAAFLELRTMGLAIFLNIKESIILKRILCNAEQSGGLYKELPAFIVSRLGKKEGTKDEVVGAFHEFYERRSKIYRAICDKEVELEDAPKSQNAQKVLDAIRGGF